MRKKDIDMQLPTNTISDLNVADLNYCRGRWTPVWVPSHGTVRGGAPSPTWLSTAAFMSRSGGGAGTPWRNKYCLNVSVNLESCLFKENSGMSVFFSWQTGRFSSRIPVVRSFRTKWWEAACESLSSRSQFQSFTQHWQFCFVSWMLFQVFLLPGFAKQ